MSRQASAAKPTGVTIRRSLVRNLVLLIVLTAGAILGLTVVQSSQAVEDLSRSLVNRSTAQVMAELRGFFEPVKNHLREMDDWGRAGLLPFERDPLARLLIPVLRRQPPVSSLVLGREDGRGFMILQEPERFRLREVQPANWGETAHWTHYDTHGQQTEETQEELGYDPRTRPWYQAAQAADGDIAWTEPYAFFTTQDPGITASMRVAGQRTPTVVGLDVLLTDISRFTSHLDVSEHGEALVISDDGRVVGLPRDPRFEDEERRRGAVLRPLGELDLPVAQHAHEQWQAGGEADRVFATEVDGERWWVGMRRFELGGGRAFWIEVVVPEHDFLEKVERQRNIIIGVVFVALLLAVLMALWLARAYSRPLEALAARAEKIRTLDLSPDETPPGSQLREVVMLSEAQERMRAAIESFSRYVPLEVVRELIRRGEVAKLGGRHAELSILFTDIEGFTSDSEHMSPAEVAEHVGEYFDAMLSILKDEQATVDKLIGDAIMAFWGAPTEDPAHARHALEAVLRCRARLAELAQRWGAADLPTLPTRFGLHTGEVIVGNVGSHDRLSYTLLGDSVNLAARLEGANKVWGTWVIASRAFKDAVGDGYEWRWVDRVAVKGRGAAVDVFEPLGRRGEVDEAALRFRDTYEDAFERYRAADFEGALEALEALEGRSVERLRARCEELSREGVPDGWAGESKLQSK